MNTDTKNSVAKISQNQKLAFQAMIKPHAALKSFANFSDAVIGQARGMAIVDKMDELLAENDLISATTNLPQTETQDTNILLHIYEAKMQKSLVEERIKQRISKIKKYAEYMEEMNKMTRQLKNAVEQYGFTDKENVAFYRLLREQIIRKSS